MGEERSEDQRVSHRESPQTDLQEQKNPTSETVSSRRGPPTPGLTEQRRPKVPLDNEAPSRPESRTEDEDSRIPSSSSSSSVRDPPPDLSSLQPEPEPGSPTSRVSQTNENVEKDGGEAVPGFPVDGGEEEDGQGDDDGQGGS